MAAEQYNRLARLVDRGLDVELELDVRTRFHDDDPTAYNTLAEIPGTDKRGEVVMVGAHLDSWHAGTGATDNAAGSAVVMEAVRILRALDVRPRRTIRIALWSGEEQGLLGSRAYVAEHFGSRPARRIRPSATCPRSCAATRARDGASRTTRSSPPTSTSTTAPAASAASTPSATRRWRPIFEAWLAPFKDLGADHGHPAADAGHRPRHLRRRRPARLPVHPGRRGLRDAHAPHEPRRVRPRCRKRTSCRRRW